MIPNILKYVLAVNLVIVGIDKFFFFLPACSLNAAASPTSLAIVGIIEIILGILLLANIRTKLLLIITILLMIFAIVAHLSIGTTDIAFAVIGLITTVYLYYKLPILEK
ncbi:MAG: hypothetical protein AB8G22_02465 [Saprospiraceae bacterium]